MQKPAAGLRIDGLDVARGTALVAMATYHFAWDLELFGYLEAGTAASGFLKLYARMIASSFLFIVGFSLVLATQNGVKWKLFLIRVAQVAVTALVISIATYFVMPNGWIFFGILHHIVAASLVGVLFIRLPWQVTLVAAVLTFVLPQTGLFETHARLLSFDGLSATPPNSNDFVPLFPWLAASLSGIAAARLIVGKNWLAILASPKATGTPARQLKFLGRHSLIFYILHQPILIGIVWIATQIMPPVVKIAESFQAECNFVCAAQFSALQCQTYCNCFESELKDGAAQWSQLPADSQSKAISQKCTQIMQVMPAP